MTGPDSKHYALGTHMAPAGTATVNIGNPIVTGAGTSFLSIFNDGDTIIINGEEHTVSGAPISNTVLVTVGNWGQTIGGVAIAGYSMTPDISAIAAYPKGLFVPYSQPLDLGSGAIRGGGWPAAEWQWKFMPRLDRERLRSFWPVAPLAPVAALLRVRTQINDHNDTYANFVAQAIWPQLETKDAQRRVPFAIRFRAMVAIDPT